MARRGEAEGADDGDRGAGRPGIAGPGAALPMAPVAVEPRRGWSPVAKVGTGCGLGVAAFVGVVAVVVFLFGQLDGCEVFDAGPGRGTHSQHLAITVTPSHDLTAGQVVTVSSVAFEPDSIVGVAVCLKQADTRHEGVEACDKSSGSRYAADHQGRVVGHFRIPRVITVAGNAFDCAEATTHCLVVAADSRDFDRSGGQPISFRPGLPTVPLEPGPGRPQTDHLPVVGPTGAVPAGEPMHLQARGFEPGEPVLVAWCTSRFAELGPTETCEPQRAADALSALMVGSVAGIRSRAGSDGTVSLSIPAQADVLPYVDDPDAGSSTTGRAGRTRRPRSTDCTKPGRCLVVIAAAADTKRSAVWGYRVEG